MRTNSSICAFSDPTKNCSVKQLYNQNMVFQLTANERMKNRLIRRGSSRILPVVMSSRNFCPSDVSKATLSHSLKPSIVFLLYSVPNDV